MEDKVLIAEKVLHKGVMFGNISSGGGVIDLGNGKAMKFIALNEKFVKLQLIEYGIGGKIETQRWQKTKKVTIAKPTITKEQLTINTEPIQQGDLLG